MILQKDTRGSYFHRKVSSPGIFGDFPKFAHTTDDNGGKATDQDPDEPAAGTHHRPCARDRGTGSFCITDISSRHAMWRS
jgi:hypothetical protein